MKKIIFTILLLFLPVSALAADCGLASTMIITSLSASTTYATIMQSGVLKYIPLNSYSNVDFQCSGLVDLACSACDVIVIPLSDGGFNETFLLGLAGLLCGFILAYVIAKTAL